jgi:hypothetical protein
METHGEHKMKLEAKQRLMATNMTTAAPVYTKLSQLGRDLAKYVFDQDNLDSRNVKKNIALATQESVRIIGRASAEKAEKFLQQDASTATWRAAINGNCASKDVCAFVEEFEINYGEL